MTVRHVLSRYIGACLPVPYFPSSSWILLLFEDLSACPSARPETPPPPLSGRPAPGTESNIKGYVPKYPTCAPSRARASPHASSCKLHTYRRLDICKVLSPLAARAHPPRGARAPTHASSELVCGSHRHRERVAGCDAHSAVIVRGPVRCASMPSIPGRALGAEHAPRAYSVPL